MQATTIEQKKIVRWLHSMPAGDLLSLMPGFKQIYESSGNKALIYQKVDHSYGMFGAYLGAKYSIKNEEGEPVTMNRMVFEAVKPLLLAQDYIEDFVEWNGEDADFNFDVLREYPSTMPGGCINRWAFYVWPDMACDLSKKWLQVKEEDEWDHNLAIDSILINRTERYNNSLISYSFLKKYKHVYFVGLDDEYNIFCKQNKIDIPRLKIAHYSHLAASLNQCKFYIGGQSSIFQVAEGLKIPRLLEVCKDIPNVIGSGPGFYDFLTQRSLEYYVEKLFNQ